MSRTLTAEQAGLVRVFREFGFSRAAVAGEYGVHPDTIRNIENGTSFTKTARRKDRKLTDDEVRQVHAWGKQGHREQKIATLLGNKISRSTVRQILAGKSYQDVR